MHTKSKKITLTAVFIAAGILFPILFHMVSLGKAMLPMYWPVAISAFILPIPTICIIAISTPILSMFLTGMPPVSPPIMQIIILELITLVLTVGLLKKKTSLGNIWILLTGLISSRLILMVGAPLFAWTFGLPRQWFFWGRLLESLPGFFTMLVAIPLLLKRIMNQPLFKGYMEYDQ